MRSGAVAILLTMAGPGHAEVSQHPLLHAEGTVHLKAAPERVWNVVGDFTGLHRWHPGVKGTTLLEGTNRKPPAVRQLDLGEGQWLISELLEWNGKQHTLRYRILKSPLPIVNYVATYAVKPAPNGGSTFVWKTDFRRQEGAGVDDAAAKKIVQEVIDQGLAKLPRVVGE
ncbi:MAG: SRPBCC family protein [Rubrivivax sp.]